MRIWCKDYRAKMAKEDENFKLDTNVKSKSSEKSKSIFLKKQSSAKINPSLFNSDTNKGGVKACPSPGFKFNFKLEDTKEGLEQMDADDKKVKKSEQKYKFVKSDNTFKFNFSIT